LPPVTDRIGYLAMKTLAEVLLFALETLSMAEEPGLDWQACGDVTNDMWLQLAKTSPEERRALSDGSDGAPENAFS
jgi:hypothetical protein